MQNFKHLESTNDNNQPHLEQLFQLSRQINASLDLKQQLNTFYEHLKQTINIASLHYQNSVLTLGYEFNKVSQSRLHQCQYTLILEEENLGEIQITRKQRFSETETVYIESLLSVLVLPVRNALQYLTALKLANTDALTGVNNRQSFDRIMDREIKLANRNFFKLSLLLIDVDNFKTINDNDGHLAGDEALKSIANSIINCTRDTDRVFRYGGDEFVVLLDNTDECRARLVGERIRMFIENTENNPAQRELQVTIGTATLLPHDNKDSLFARADNALYKAKDDGKNCVVTEVSVNHIINGDDRPHHEHGHGISLPL